MNDDRAPWCYLDKKIVGYTVSDKASRTNGFDSTLTLKSTAKKSFPFEEIAKLKLSVSYLSENILRIKVTDPAHKRYEVPIQSRFNIPTGAKGTPVYDVALGDDFHLNVTRRSSGVKILDTSIGGLVYSDQFIQFASYLASKDVYGFGENYHLSFKREFDYTTLPMFARDHGVGNVSKNLLLNLDN